MAGKKGATHAPPEERVWRHIVKTSCGCWAWLGATTKQGYANFHDGKRNVPGHVFLWEQENGPKPENMDLDHLCRIRACVNPAHLELVTRQINLLRGDTIPARNSEKTHCPKGHEYTPENTGLSKRGQRDCKVCRRRRDVEYKSRKRAKSRLMEALLSS